jgi:K+-dependent Na+/Ca+ exchanger-like protein
VCEIFVHFLQIIIVIGLFVAFWGLAVVCEDYFVPSITIMCEYNKIPDDVAGATFMAAGASSPEMFACFVSLFVTHTALGAGTIIGSEIFNHLVICAAAVLYANGGELQLDWRLVLRESLFYLMALLLLIAALSLNSNEDGSLCQQDVYTYYRKANRECNQTGGNFLHDSTDYEDWHDPEFQPLYCIYWWQALILIVGYVCYALTCAYYQKIMARFCPDKSPEEQDSGKTHMPQRTRTSMHESEPVGNFKRDRNSHHNVTTGDLQIAAFAPSHLQGNFLWNVHDSEELSKENGDSSNKFSCFMYKRSRFYHVRAISHNAWKLRWFEIDSETGLKSYSKPDLKTKQRTFPLDASSTVEIMDEERLLFGVTNAKHGKMIFHSPNMENMMAMYERIDAFIKARPQVANKSTNPMIGGPQDELQEESADNDGEDHDHHVLIAWPTGGGPLAIAIHVILLIPKYLIYYSIPDVRIPHGPDGEKKYPQAIAMCFVWLVGWSLVMAECLDVLGTLAGISELVMGMTISAVGTSFPNVFASIIVAKQGLGNMACSNALGGNVFNIFMGLGLPWFCFTLLGSDFTLDSSSYLYFGMAYGGTGNAVLFPIIILVILIVANVALLIYTGWKLYKIHAYIFIAIYVGFLIWVLAYNTVSPIDG